MKNCYAIAFCICVDVKNRRSLCREPGLMEGAEGSRGEQRGEEREVLQIVYQT